MSSQIADFYVPICVYIPHIEGFADKLHAKAKVLLGGRIRTLRNMQGWTQQELGSQRPPRSMGGMA